jgi:hypothetical protein
MFPVFFREPNVFVKLSSFLIVFSRMMMYSFMADLNAVKLFELVRDLFWAPIILQPIINDFPFWFSNYSLGFLS